VVLGYVRTTCPWGLDRLNLYVIHRIVILMACGSCRPEDLCNPGHMSTVGRVA